MSKNVLAEIVANKENELIELKKKLPLSLFKASLRPSKKSLFNAIKQNTPSFILECKKASPSKGLIRAPFDLDEILSAYTPHASAISVLTDEKYFQGHYEYLRYITQRVHQPVLNKDFFVDTYQVYLARYYQADAVLLMLSVLDDNAYKELAEVARELGMDVLTEVSNEEEMDRAIELNASIIGINNRNLRDLSTDLATTESLKPMLKKATHDYVLLSESGIHSHEDVQRLAPLCDGFLVGSALMAERNLSRAVKTLIFGNTKICGMCSSSDAKSALAAGATHLGLIRVNESSRCISLSAAKSLVNDVPSLYVGVYRNAEQKQIIEEADALGLSAVQLHGDETSEYRKQLKIALNEEVEIWQAYSIDAESMEQSIDSIQALLDSKQCDRVVLDSKVNGQSGGTGKAFDWRLIESLEHSEKIVLAGGIGMSNINVAANIKVGMLDINSQAEIYPGKKNPFKLHHVLQAKRSAAATLEQ